MGKGVKSYGITLVQLIYNDKGEGILKYCERTDNGALFTHEIILNNSLNIYKSINILKSLNTGVKVEFKELKQYEELVSTINEMVTKKWRTSFITDILK